MREEATDIMGMLDNEAWETPKKDLPTIEKLVKEWEDFLEFAKGCHGESALFSFAANVQTIETALEAFRDKMKPPACEPSTRFSRIRACQTPEEMAVELNANSRRFCPKSYWRKEPTCTVPCGECITAWLREEAAK